MLYITALFVVYRDVIHFLRILEINQRSLQSVTIKQTYFLDFRKLVEFPPNFPQIRAFLPN